MEISIQNYPFGVENSKEIHLAESVNKHLPVLIPNGMDFIALILVAWSTMYMKSFRLASKVTVTRYSICCAFFLSLIRGRGRIKRTINKFHHKNKMTASFGQMDWL